MKKLTSFVFCAIIAVNSMANPLFPEQASTLFDHMQEVNKEWNNFYCPDDYQEVYCFSNESQRIRMHLKIVESHLRNNPPNRLKVNQLEKRNQTLDFLKAYYKNEVFPINHYHPVRQPYFIDNLGTACAVGQLIIDTGYKSLAQQISEENNFAYIRELQSEYPQLLEWAEEYGFTLDELAWIQPGYPPNSQRWNAVGNGGGTDGVVNVMKAFDNEMLYLAGDFTSLDGVEANSIIGWDGNSWHTLNNGINGEIHDISIDDEGRVFIGGDFTVNGNSQIKNVAYWFDNQWFGFNTSNMYGQVNVVHVKDEILYIGGDFEINYQNNTIENLAFININNNDFETQNGDFSVDDIVFDITDNGNEIYVGGAFLMTASQSVNSSINKLSTSHMATWGFDVNIGSNNWLQGFEQEIGPSINSILVTPDKTYIGANSEEVEGLGIGTLEDSEWTYNYCGKIDDTYYEIIDGFLVHNGITIAYGNLFYVGEFSFLISPGITVLENNTNTSNGAIFDAPVFAAESFQDQIYFAGLFTSVQWEDFPGLVSTPFDGTSNAVVESSGNLNVFSSVDQINIQYENLTESFEFNVYNLNGQLITQSSLEPGTAENSVSTQHWADGIYIYQAVSKSGNMISGKVSVID